MHAVSRLRLAVTAALLSALAFTGLSTITTAVSGPAPAEAATTAEGFWLTTPGGGRTFAGNQTVPVQGKAFVGPCIDPGLPGPTASGKPVAVADNLARFGGNFPAAARILNDPRLANGTGKVNAAVRWAALNRLLDGATGRAYNARWTASYAAQLAKHDASIPGRVQALINEARKPLPANTWRYDTVSLTPEQKGRQTLAAAGFSALASYVCPPECIAQGITTFQASNKTRDTYRLRAIEVGTGRVLYTSPTLRPGDTVAAAPRFPDTTRIRVGVEKWTAKGWSPLHYFAEFEVVCPTPPKVEVITRTCCVDGTVVIVQVKNTTRRTAGYDLAIGGRTWSGQLAPGKVVTQGPARITSSTLVTGTTYVYGPNGKPTGVEVTGRSTVHPGTAKPVVKTSTT